MEDRSNQVLIVAIFFFVTSWISVLLRIYVRTRASNGFGYDDMSMVATLLFFTAYTACQLGGVAHGTGKHRDAITDADAEIALRYWWFCELFYTITTSLLKVAIGLFLLRITINKYQIWIIRIIMICSSAFGIAYCFVVIFQCQPVSFWWNLDPNAKGKCLSRSLFADAGYVVSVLNSVADWTFGILPIFIVKNLQMKTTVKVIVATILGFGAIASTATIIRIPYIHTIVGYKGDFLWRTTDVAIWTTVEIGVGITAGCVATLKPLLKSFMQLIGRTSSTFPNKNNTSKLERKRKPDSYPAQHLDPLRPANDTTQTKTTITGRRRSSLLQPKGLRSWGRKGSNEDDIVLKDFPGGMDMSFLDGKTWNGGISKSVEVTTMEERRYSKMGESSGSSSQEECDLERAMPSKPATAHERF